MSAEQHISPQDYELLSAYIDGELSSSEHTTFEQRLAIEPILQQELNSLQTTVSLINRLPAMTAPRNFTLTDDMVNKPKVIQFKRRRNQTSYLSMVASIAIMIMGMAIIFTDANTMQMSSNDAFAPVQSEPVSEKITDEPTLGDLQRERTQEEPAPAESFAFDADNAPEEDGAALNLQAPTDETSSDRDDNFADTTDGFSGESTEFFEAVVAEEDAEQNVSGVMAGADIAEAEEVSDTEILTDTGTTSDDSVANSQVVGAIDEADSSASEAQDTVDDLTQGRSTVTATNEVREELPTPPQSPQTQPVSSPEMNTLLIGLGLLIFGFLMFGASAILIRRNRG